MDSIVQSLTALTGQLVASGKEETAKLDSLKNELSEALNTNDWLVNRRETPFVSSQVSRSIPAWAAGRQITRTAGPFRDSLGRLFWYDFYRIRRQLKVIRKGAALPFLSIPFDDSPLVTKVKPSFHLRAGSVWCVAKHITAGAPAGTFTGLTIRSGTIRFQGNISISGDTITIGETDSCHLELELAQPDTDIDSGSPTGNDAKIMDLMLPEKLVLDCLPGGIHFNTVSKIGLTVYGSSYHFSHAARPIRYDTILNRIFIPFDNNRSEVEILHCDSPFITLEKSAPLTENAWALPVTQASSMDQLGPAAGIGGIAMLMNGGIKISWKGLENSPIRCNKNYLLADPGRIAITVLIAISGHNRQTFDLWQLPQHPDNPVFSRASFQYPKQFALLYNCLSTSVEALLAAEVGATLSVDRPVTADQKKPSITTDKAELLLFRLKNLAYCYLQATRILDRLLQLNRIDSLYPISFALSNALIKTTPIDDFYLLGVVENDRSIVKGALKLIAHIYQLLPSLPDPYVSSFSLPTGSFYNRKELYSRAALSGIDLYALTGWSDPGTVQTLLGFEKTAIIPGAGAAAGTAIPTAAGQPQPLSSATTLTNANPTGADPASTAADNPSIAAIYAPTVTTNIRATAFNTAAGKTSDAPGAAGGQAAAPAASTPFATQTFMESIAINPILQTRQEDDAAGLGLLNYFEKAFGARIEGNIILLDVSTNADLMGVGLGTHSSRDKQEVALPAGLPFSIRGIDLVTYAINTKVYTLPQIQWEPIRTIQNPDTSPYPFPSPATSPRTGIPTLMAVESYDLVPIAPRPVIDKFLSAYNADTGPGRIAGLFNLPFGMIAAALWDNAKDKTRPGASLNLNQPEFDTARVTGGIQVAVIASSPDAGDEFETAGFKGATIQTRNLIELLTGNVPVDDEGHPLSVLGPVVDTIFNAEFNPAGANPRVPVERMDISGYGASMFSNWLNPNAVIAATSQAKFDVWIGRTSHEIIQVKSILYPWGVPVVRTITIQRTSGSGVTRYDSGWKAQGPGNYDFSYYVMTGSTKTKIPNPFEIHPGAVKEVNHITSIRDTGRMYRKPGAIPTDDVIMQEVLFDTDVLIEDAGDGATNGYVPSKVQRGFVQLAPYQKPLTPEQFYTLLQEEGPLGGPLDCIVNVGLSGQTMRVLKADVSGVDNMGGGYVFVSSCHGSIHLPREGSWSLVKRKENSSDIITIDPDAGLPLIREGKLGVATTKPYRFSDPGDILQSADPSSDYGILHSTGTQKILFLRPTILRGDTHIKSTLQPYLADSFAIVHSTGIFPDVNTTFPLGAVTGASLQIIDAGRLKLVSGGNYKAPAGTTRNIVQSGTSRIYVDYSDAAGSGDTSEFNYSFDSNAAVPWTAVSKNHSLVVDLAGFNSLVTVTTEFDAAYGQKPSMPKPTTKFGSILQPIVDMLSFLGGQDISQALAVSMSNLNTTSWQPKLQAIMGVEIEFKTFLTGPPKFEVKLDHAGLDGEPPIPMHTPDPEPLPILILGCDIDLKAYFNMNPQTLTGEHDDGTPATPAEIDEATTDMISSGATLEIEGELHVLCYTITPNVAGVYFIGILGFEFGIDDSAGKSFGFKVAMGLEVRAQWPVVGEVSVMMAIGLEMEWSDTGSGIFALIIFKGEAELLGGLIVIGIGIEAKGGQEKEINSSGVTETYAIVEVEFAVEVSLAFVIHFEFDETWQEKRQTA